MKSRKLSNTIRFLIFVEWNRIRKRTCKSVNGMKAPGIRFIFVLTCALIGTLAARVNLKLNIKNVYLSALFWLLK